MEIILDLDSPDIILGETYVGIDLSDGKVTSAYELVINIMPMEIPRFADWESYSEIEMSLDDINVTFLIPEYEQNSDDIVSV